MADSRMPAPPVPLEKQPRNPLSLKQVEKVISRSVAGFGIVFGAQTVPLMLGQLDEATPLWLWAVIPGLFGTLLVVLLFSIVKVWVRRAHGLFAFLYLGALISWPFGVIPGFAVPPNIHWLYYLLTVGTAMAAIAFSTRWGTIYLFVAPMIYSAVRVTPQGGGVTWQLAVVEGVYSIILGAGVLIVVTMLRQAATNVDTAQATALDRYGFAVRQHATEVERVEVDSIVHDSVLTTFISAGRAHTPQAHALAATMASNAIGHLRDAAAVNPDDTSTMPVSALASKIAESASELSTPFRVKVRNPGKFSLPIHAADAVHSAAVQAMVNSMQHAGEAGVSRWVNVRGISPDGIEVVVGDDGAGFAMSELSGERLGVRVSIIERIANAGGLASILSSPQGGAVVTIRWPHQSTQTPIAAALMVDPLLGGGGVQ